MYLMSYTRPDIAYLISKLSSYMSNFRAKHWQGILRVLKYLCFTLDYGLHDTRYPIYLKDTVMQIRYQMLKTQNPIVIMCLH